MPFTSSFNQKPSQLPNADDPESGTPSQSPNNSDLPKSGTAPNVAVSETVVNNADPYKTRCGRTVKPVERYGFTSV